MNKQVLIISGLAFFWATLLGFALITKSRAGFAGLPIVGLLLLGYTIYATYKVSKTDKPEEKNSENKQ